MWQNKYKKAITLSYDDGIKQDIRLVQLLNKYQLKATFNINTGLSDPSFDFFIDGHRIEHLSFEDMIPLYQGHEVAVHTVTHPFLTNLSDREINNEIVDDITKINHIFKQKPVGMAYPYGIYDDRVVDCVKASGLSITTNRSFKI
jgi:peptidoglycan/xylan/chitin deacetylase (PgdA/CDA1 family)